VIDFDDDADFVLVTSNEPQAKRLCVTPPAHFSTSPQSEPVSPSTLDENDAEERRAASRDASRRRMMEIESTIAFGKIDVAIQSFINNKFYSNFAYTTVGRLSWLDFSDFYFWRIDYSCNNITLPQIIYVLSLPSEFTDIEDRLQKLFLIVDRTLLSDTSSPHRASAIKLLDTLIKSQQPSSAHAIYSINQLTILREFVEHGIPLIRNTPSRTRSEGRLDFNVDERSFNKASVEMLKLKYQCEIPRWFPEAPFGLPTIHEQL